MTRCARAMVLLLPLGLSACLTSGDLSNSSKSSSKSISSPFKWSSESSSGGGGESAYLGDVETLAIAYLEQPTQQGAFLRDLTRVAAEHGISDWEASPHTLEAVGAGLRRGGASPALLDAFVTRHLGDLPGAAERVRRGYADGGPSPT